jgi:hypothetical protein
VIDAGLMEVRSGEEQIVGLLTNDEFEHYWPEIEKMLDALPHTWIDMTKDSIVSRVFNGSLQVWVMGERGIQMILFTQIAVFPRGSALQIIWCAGEGLDYEKAGPGVEAALEFFAKTQGCKRIDVIGRPGWEKVLASWGFRRTEIVLSRPVADESLQ